MGQSLKRFLSDPATIKAIAARVRLGTWKMANADLHRHTRDGPVRGQKQMTANDTYQKLWVTPLMNAACRGGL